MNAVRRRRMSRIVAATAAALLVTTVAACGDDNDDDAASSSVSVDSSSFPGKAASGAAVKIGLISAEDGQAVSLPETREAAEAATTYANENLGGIAGRPIELVSCKQQEEPASARNCANQMVEQKVNAVVVTNTGMTSVIAPIVTRAGIPYVTSVAGGMEDATGDKAFVWTSGASATLAMANYATQQKMTSVVAYSMENPAALGALEMIAKPAFKAAGIDFNVVSIPFGSPDATPQVSAGLKHKPQGAIILGESTVCTSVLKALGTLGSDAQIMTPQPCVAPDVAKAVGDSGIEGVKVFSNADTESDDAESKLYRDIMAKYSPETDTSGYAVTGYQGMLALIRATAGLTGDVTPDTIITAVRGATDVVLPAGLGITFTCDGTAVTGIKGVCSNQRILSTVKDGKLTGAEKIGLLGS